MTENVWMDIIVRDLLSSNGMFVLLVCGLALPAQVVVSFRGKAHMCYSIPLCFGIGQVVKLFFFLFFFKKRDKSLS